MAGLVFLLGYGIGRVARGAVFPPPKCDLYTRMEMGDGWTREDQDAEDRVKALCQARNKCLDLFDKQADNEYKIRCRAPLPKEIQ